MKESVSPDGIGVDAIGPATTILDVRRRAGKRQIRGALRYDPHALLQADALSLPLDRESPIAVYGDSEKIVGEIVDRLRKQGYGGAAPLRGGIEAWENARLPMEDATQEQPVPGEPGSGMRRL